MTEVAIPHLEDLNDMYLDYRAVRINLRTLGLPGLTKEQAQGYITHVHEAIEGYEEKNKEYSSIPFQPGQKELYEKVEQSWQNFKGVGKRALDYYAQGTPEAKNQLIKIFLEDCPAAAKTFTEAMNTLKKYHTDGAHKDVEMAKATTQKTNQLIFLSAIIGIFAGLAVGLIFATKVATSLNKVADQLSSNADRVASSSAQIASSSQQLSQATTEQAASLEETAAALEEITSMVAKAAESASTTESCSNESQSKAEEGRNSVEQMLASMEEISQSNDAIMNQVNQSNQEMTEIVKVIQDIGNQTKVINEIVFQTKLLSFNASVEAARAGEQGKGFAVVAEEVGNLAQMSGNAAKEITEMLEASIVKVEKIVKETKSKVEVLVEQGKQKVESGVVVAKECSNVLEEIVQNVTKVTSLAQEISTASREQSTGIGEINKAMSQLDTVTQQNSATSSEAAASAAELSSQAELLKHTVVDLVAMVHGESSTAHSFPAVDAEAAESTVVPMKKDRFKTPKSA